MNIDQLKSELLYDPETGTFTRLSSKQRPDLVGKPAGSVNKTGYVYVCVLGRKYRAHRLAWFYVYGYWPAEDVDHINRNRQDNRIVNLREASRSENNLNSKPRERTLPKGVRKTRSGLRFEARIGRRHIGYFDTAEKAEAAYLKENKYYEPQRT